MSIPEIAHKLAEYCRKGDWAGAQKALYANDAVSIEMKASPAFDKETKGLDAIIAKGHKFDAMVEQVHSITVSEPIVGGDAFAFALKMDVTMKGRGRIPMEEIAVYEVKDGKIVSEQFHM